jgi:enoyl-CoA hydratase/carnithine racemase
MSPSTPSACPDPIRTDRRGAAAWLRLNRPHRRNALTPELVACLAEAIRAADTDDDIRVIVLTGAAPAFCAGADLTYFQAMTERADGLDRFLAELLHPLADALARLRASGKPVIAAVNGACVAGGLEIVLACDLVVASSTATFCDAHARRGLAPALGTVGSLVHAIGSYRAKRVLLASDVHDAATMRELGLVAEVVEPDALTATVDDLADTLARRSPRSLALLKAMVHRSEQPPWADRLAADLADFAAGWATVTVDDPRLP